MTIIWKQTLGSRLAVILLYRVRTFSPYEAWLRRQTALPDRGFYPVRQKV